MLEPVKFILRRFFREEGSVLCRADTLRHHRLWALNKNQGVDLVLRQGAYQRQRT